LKLSGILLFIIEKMSKTILLFSTNYANRNLILILDLE
jgi:hypothetical protein